MWFQTQEHTSRKENFSWGSVRSIEANDHSHSVAIQPEVWSDIKDVSSGKKQNSSFKDETGRFWNIVKHESDGVVLSTIPMHGQFKHHLTSKEISTLD